MESSTARIPPGPRVAWELVAGLMAGLVAITYALSYAALLFQGPLASHLSFGVSLALVSASLGTLFAGLCSSFKFAVSGPDSNTTAILAVTLAALADRLVGGAAPGDQIDRALLLQALTLLFLATALTGAALFALGRLALGTWVRYIPYPVMGGFLAATGWFITNGALGICADTSVAKLAARWPALVAGGPDPRLLAGVALAVLFLWGLRRFSHPVAVPLALLGATAATYAGLWAAGLDADAARAAGWLFPRLEQPELALPWTYLREGGFDLAWLAAHAGDLVAVVAVSAITVLLSATGLEVATDTDADLDRELVGNGVANLLSAALGGYLGLLSIGRSLTVHACGGATRLPGIVVAVSCGAMLAGGTAIVAYLPKVVLGAFLLYLGLTLLHDWLIAGRRRLSRQDYALVVLILGITVAFGFTVGVLLGTVAACTTFAFNYSRLRVIRRELSGSEVRSTFERPMEDKLLLDRHGRDILVLQFQGFLFFGTANVVREHVRNRLVSEMPRTPESSLRDRHASHVGQSLAADHGPRFVVCDFLAVDGVDTSACVTFQKIRQIAAGLGRRLVFVNLSDRLERLLADAGCLAPGDACCHAEPDLDRGLEWCEDQVLRENRAERHAERSALAAWLAAELGGSRSADALLPYTELLTFAPGQYVFRQGEPSDSLFLVESGRVTVFLESPDGGRLRLRSMLGGTFLGEMGLYTSEPRSASVVADEPSVLRRLSAAALEHLQEERPDLAGPLHSAIVRVLSKRLADANLENSALRRWGISRAPAAPPGAAGAPT